MPAAASRAKSTYNSKAAPAAKKSSAPSGKATGPKLRIRYARVMKPQRVYGLIVEVPGSKKKKDDVARGGIVVVRPIIPGAQVVPAEHRLEVATHRGVVQLDGPHETSVLGDHAMPRDRAVEADVGERLYGARHLARLVELERHRFGRKSGVRADLERELHRCAEVGSDGLLDQQVEGCLVRGGEA